MTKKRTHIVFIDPNGIQYNGDTLETRGLGGSEAAVVSMARELSKIGFRVTVYNNCDKVGRFGNVDYRNIGLGPQGAPPDVVISVRSPTIFYENPNPIQGVWAKEFVSKAKLKVLWMHDTFTNDESSLEPLVSSGLIDEIWTLSDFHTTYITNCDHTGTKRNFEMLKNKIWQTRNGINYYPGEEQERDHNHFVFNASYTKGMRVLLDKVWPLLRSRIQDARLTVIGGYYTFPDGKIDKQGEDVARWREQYKDDPHTKFTGIISPEEVAEVLKSAGFMLYPTEFPETFGISTLESIAYRTPVITTRFGALEETALDMACYKLPYSTTPNVLFPKIDEDWQVKKFVEMAYQAWDNTYLYMQKQNYCDIVKDICTWDTVALQWKQHLYQKLDMYLDVHEYRKVRYISTKVNKLFGRRFHNPEDFVEASQYPEQRINIVTTVRNGAAYIADCMRSVAAQDYTNYKMYIADDGSEDNTRQVIDAVLDDLGWTGHFNIQMYYQNKKGDRDGAVANQLRIFEHITNVRDTESKLYDDIIIILDGDDKLRNDPGIFKRINDIYQRGKVRFTYGSCWSMADKIPLIAQDYPEEVKNNKSYRQHKFPWNIPYTHLRTFRADLLKGIRKEQLRDSDGNWMMAGGDAAMFYEMIERCKPDEILAVKELLVDYNDLNPLNDYKVNSDEQTRNAKKAVEQTVMPKKILVAIPTARYIEPETFKSIYDQVTPGGATIDFQYFYGYNVDQVRNLIAHYAMENNYDYLMCVDHDIAFDSTTIARLYAHQQDIVGGIYRQRRPSQVLEVFNMVYQPYYSKKVFPEKGLFEVGAIGLGCALIKVDVLRKIGYPQFDYHRAIKIEDTISEDVDFCQKSRKAGYRIFIDPEILCEHHGQTVYRVD